MLGVLELEVEVLVLLVVSPSAHQPQHVAENLGDGLRVAAVGDALSDRLAQKKEAKDDVMRTGQDSTAQHVHSSSDSTTGRCMVDSLHVTRLN